MNNSPFDKAVEDKAQKHCESCRWMRQRRADDVKVEAGYDHARHWCEKIDSPTLPLALRCGGDDWESIPSPQERRDAEANLNHELFEFKKRHGLFHATQWMIGQLVTFQREGTITKADYQGDDFRVSVSVKKRR